MNRFFQTEDGAPIPVEEVKVNLLKLINANLKAALLKTDWQVVRAADPTSEKTLSEVVFSQRQAARNLAVSLEAQINDAATIEVLQEIYEQHLAGQEWQDKVAEIKARYPKEAA